MPNWLFPGGGYLETFEPDRDLPPLKGKVIFVTGGTAGIGRMCVERLAKHEPEHIYFTGRNAAAGRSLISELQTAKISTALTFVEMDMASLPAVKAAAAKFAHSRLDILICNAGIMNTPPGLSKDGFEIQFAVNHLAHAMLIRELLPMLSRTAKQVPDADVRVVHTTSVAFRGSRGIDFDSLRTTQDKAFGSWIRYQQSKLANVLYAAEMARRYPDILSVSVHPGVVNTGLVANLTFGKKAAVYVPMYLTGERFIPQERGANSQLWLVGAPRGEIETGSCYYPVGLRCTKLGEPARNDELAAKLWKWTDEVLAQY